MVYINNINTVHLILISQLQHGYNQGFEITLSCHPIQLFCFFLSYFTIFIRRSIYCFLAEYLMNKSSIVIF